MHDYSISAKVDADAGDYIFHVHGLKAGDPEWALRIGDCLRNARTAPDPFGLLTTLSRARSVFPTSHGGMLE